MDATDRAEMNRGTRSLMNVFAVSLFVAYVSAYLLVFFVPIYVVFFIPIVIIYFVAPKLKKLSTQPGNTSYRNGRFVGLAMGLTVGVLGFMYGLGPVLDAVNSGTVGDGSSIATNAVGVLANAMYLIAFLVGYFRSK